MGSRDAAVCCDSRSWQFALHQVQIPDFASGKSPPCHKRHSAMLYKWCDTVRGGCNPFTNSSLYIWPKDFELWFVSPKDFIPLLYCPVFVHLGLLEPFDIVLLPKQWFLDGSSAMWANCTEFSPSGCWQIFFFFSWHCFSCAVMFGEVSLLSHELVTDEIVLRISKTGCIL